MSLIDNRTDYELVEAYQNGEKEAFVILLNRHKQKVYNYILSLVKQPSRADDFFQDTFIKVIITLKDGTYHEQGKFIYWVLRIAHNLVIDEARRNQKQKLVYSSSDRDIFDGINIMELPLEDRLIKEQNASDIRFLISLLSKEQRQVLVMRQYANMSFKEIALATGVSINTSLGRMRYALINLRRFAKEYDMNFFI